MMQSLLANAGEGKKKSWKNSHDSSRFAIPDDSEKGLFNGLKKNSLWEVTDYLKQQRSSTHLNCRHTEVDAKETEPVKC